MESTGSSHHSIKKIVMTSVLAGFSYILMFIAFPIIPIVPFLKIDFSDIPILVGSIILGPLAGVVIAVLKCFLYWLSTGASPVELIGIGSSLVSSLCLLFGFQIIGHLFKHQSPVLRNVLSGLLATIVLVVVMVITNWGAVMPLYTNLMGMDLGIKLNQLILYGVVPFNLIKGIVISTIFILIKNRIVK